MPAHSRSFFRALGANVLLDAAPLMADGPLIQCEIRVDSNRANALASAGEAVPPSVQGQLLVDTGASMTCIDSNVITQLGLETVADCRVLTPTGGDTQTLHYCGIAFPGTRLESIDSIRVLAADLEQQTIIGLIGRDVLAMGVLIYDGQAGHWTLSF